MPTSPTARLLFPSLALILLAAAQPAPAQSPNPSSNRSQPPAATPAPTLVLDPFRIESIGLTLFAPEGSVIESTTAGSEAAAQILADQWAIQVRSHRTRDAAATPEQVVDRVTQAWIEELGVRDQAGQVSPAFANVLAREPEPGQALTVENKGNPLPVARTYLALRPDVSAPTRIRGFAAVKVDQTRFVTFELSTDEAGFPAARAAFEAVQTSAEFRDPNELRLERAAALRAGQELLSSLSPDDYSVILAQPERWERIYKPAASGLDADATEIGYRRIRAQVGPRSLLNPRGSGGTVADGTVGYVVSMTARFLFEGTPIDSESVFFMTRDRNEESWVVRNTTRDDGRPRTQSETGARSETSMSVQVDSPGSPGTTIRPTIARDRALLEAYATRVESALLPQILLRKGVLADFGFYVYQSDAQTVRIRRDRFERAEPGPNVPEGAAFVLTTRLGEDRPPQTSWFDAQGALIRTLAADGTVWEPTTPQRLLELWRSKGLPVQ